MGDGGPSGDGDAGHAADPDAADLDAEDSPGDPLALFARWFAAVRAAGLVEPDAAVLATADSTGAPSARLVLVKAVDARGLAFYTNLRSRKADELAANPRAALVFDWHVASRQVRVEGAVAAVPAGESDGYFASRPRGSALGAWASPQSRVVASRAVLEERFAAVAARFADRPVPRPPHWGGLRMVPRSWEFWRGRPDRMHDRLRYRRTATGWARERLAP